MKRRLMMTTLLSLVLVAQSAFVTGLTRTTHAAVPPVCAVIDSGTLGGSMAYTTAINKYGHVVGAINFGRSD